jgi:hypothetical protein
MHLALSSTTFSSQLFTSDSSVPLIGGYLSRVGDLMAIGRNPHLA